MANNLVDNTNYGFTEGATKGEALSIPFTISNGGSNANNCKMGAFFVWGEGIEDHQNYPSSTSGGLLLAYRLEMGGGYYDTEQIFFDYVQRKTYRRHYDGYSDSWTSWLVIGA